MKKMSKKKGLWQVMNNWGFGDLTIYRGGTKITVPQKYITKGGLIHKRVNKHIVEQNFEKLKELGVAVL